MGTVKYYVYSVAPIDNGWEDLHVLFRLPEQIATAARSLDWEGDISVGGWSPVPCETCFWPCFVWKQSNNGTTFIASPVAMKFFCEPFCFKTVIVPYEAIDLLA
jgi:hypothetical protein